MFKFLLGSIVFVLVALIIAIACWALQAYGCYKIYIAAGVEPTWSAFVPVYGSIIFAKFVVQSIGDPDWEVWVLALGWLLGIIPVIGGVAVMAWSISWVVAKFRWIQSMGSDGLPLIMLFVFSPIVPLLMVKYYE